MVTGERHVFPAARATELGFPPLEFRFRSTESLTVTDRAAEPGYGGGPVLHAEERGPTGRLFGTIELALFSASLIIDRAGVLCELARTAAGAALAGAMRGRLLGEGEVELDGGASGYRIDALLQLDDGGRLRPERPYASWLALASDNAVVSGGLLAVVHSAGPDWPAASALLASLEIGGPGAQRSRDDDHDAAHRFDLPVVRHW